jgi:drug/metabolite transporter (DMT)-like permease
VLYLILFLLIPISQTEFFNSLKSTYFNYKDINASKIILATLIVGIIEIIIAFPLYLGLTTNKLSTFISSSTIATIIFNVILGIVVFNEAVTRQFIFGLCFSIIGLYLILNSNGDSR